MINNPKIVPAFIRKHHVMLFFLLWFVVQLVQAGNTELLDDEAYYWVYSRFPAWGYFDHPPMIAMLIKASYTLFHNELGVRLLMTVMNTLTLAIIYILLPRKNDGLFYAIVCSLFVIQIGGILAVPDIPLTFFVALFFWCYKKFIEKTSLANSIVLGVVMALMLYSKYHGILIILFAFAANLSLFKKWPTYIAAFTGILLFLPHLYWQYAHDFPSVQYHLFERNASSYRVNYTLDYLAGQLLLAGPITGWLLLWAAFKYKTANAFERALKFSLAGFYGFFLISTLKGRVEANWTVPVFIPLIILSHQYLLKADRLRKILIKTVPVTLVVVLLVRIYLMLDPSTIKFHFKDEMHGNREWANSIKEKSGGLPVVFFNTYQLPSKYWFYAGEPSYSVNTYDYRRNNFNFWPIENAMAGGKVYAVAGYDSFFNDSIITVKGLKGGRIIENFYSFSSISIEHKGDLIVRNGVVNNDTIQLKGSVRYTSIPDSLLNSKLKLCLVKEDGNILIETNIDLKALFSGAKTFVQNYRVDLAKGEYQVIYTLACSAPAYTINSKRYKMIVN